MTEQVLSPQGQQCLQALMRVWFEFERQLGRVPLLQRLERGQFSKADYSVTAELAPAGDRRLTLDQPLRLEFRP
ncbi:hypothetical protein [Arsukibacterium perlucidum]|uniref:hypothetical protein n=1 Tax=Arsukibacterium perlucidum TaxID=368811 RepID=UPI0003AAAA75|nr:hypothetical protein [Arsukibacterium perlucidum]